MPSAFLLRKNIWQGGKKIALYMLFRYDELDRNRKMILRKGDAYELVEYLCILYHSHCICSILFLLEKKISLDGALDFRSHICCNQPFGNAVHS